MEEVWKPVVGFDGYEVSNFGNVRSYRKRNSTELYKEPHVIKPPVTGRGASVFTITCIQQMTDTRDFRPSVRV